MSETISKTRNYYVIETEPGFYLIQAGETTDDIDKARQYTSPEGAARGLGMAKRWMGVLNLAKIVEVKVD